jgi:hypothetical protein
MAKGGTNFVQIFVSCEYYGVLFEPMRAWAPCYSNGEGAKRQAFGPTPEFLRTYVQKSDDLIEDGIAKRAMPIYEPAFRPTTLS